MAFTEDRRTDNPGLHLLYVKWAIMHLRSIDNALKDLERHSNLNLLDIMQAMHVERQKLVDTNAAYADAQEIITAYRTGKLPEPVQVKEIVVEPDNG
jgi:hypothetical protein